VIAAFFGMNDYDLIPTFLKFYHIQCRIAQGEKLFKEEISGFLSNITSMSEQLKNMAQGIIDAVAVQKLLPGYKKRAPSPPCPSRFSYLIRSSAGCSDEGICSSANKELEFNPSVMLPGDRTSG